MRTEGIPGLQAEADVNSILKPRCVACSTEGKKPSTRLPQGWKRRGGEIYCRTCWSSDLILRAISIPVASPLDCKWDELRRELSKMWTQTTNCANWMMTELYARDFRRTDEEKMRRMEPVYLYPEARVRFPGLPSQSVASLEHSIQGKYRAKRYEVVWRSSASLPTHRYPTPFPVPAQGWNASIEGEAAVVSVRIGDARHRLRLKRGPQFHRQMESFQQIVSGEAEPGEMAIYDHGGVIVKMAAWLPRAAAKERHGTLVVRTAKDCLLVAVNAKDDVLWRYNGDHLRRWGAEHRKQLQRWADDSKYEQRPIPAFAQRREDASRKYRDRLDSVTHEIAAQLAGYADRRHFATVKYDDAERSYLGDGFPWFRLRSLIHEKLDARGVSLEVTSGDTPVEKLGPLSP